MLRVPRGVRPGFEVKTGAKKEVEGASETVDARSVHGRGSARYRYGRTLGNVPDQGVGSNRRGSRVETDHLRRSRSSWVQFIAKKTLRRELRSFVSTTEFE